MYLRSENPSLANFSASAKHFYSFHYFQSLELRFELQFEAVLMPSPTMKLSFAIFASALASVAAKAIQLPANGITADSELGMKVLSQARRVADQNQGDDAYVLDTTWVSGYALKFQGCHHIQQWNDYANGDYDVKIQTKRLVRFRLCPIDSCTTAKAGGCKSGYGDYIVDLNTFVDAYFEANRRTTEYECATYIADSCVCNTDDNQDNQEKCQYDCLAAAGKEACVDNNPYTDDQQNNQDQFQIENYMACTQWTPADNNNNRELEDNAAYYIGPYCAEQGGAVYLGLFTEDSCTDFADSKGGRTTFASLSGEDLPYSASTIVGPECVSCMNMQADNNQDNNQDQNNDGVVDACATIYNYAGKCETTLPAGVTTTPNYNACNYIEGIKIVRQDGMVFFAGPRPSATATAFIVIFALATAALAFYVYYLRIRLDIKKKRMVDIF